MLPSLGDNDTATAEINGIHTQNVSYKNVYLLSWQLHIKKVTHEINNSTTVTCYSPIFEFSAPQTLL